jgi:hypothetical protein
MFTEVLLKLLNCLGNRLVHNSRSYRILVAIPSNPLENISQGIDSRQPCIVNQLRKATAGRRLAIANMTSSVHLPEDCLLALKPLSAGCSHVLSNLPEGLPMAL